MRSRDYLGEGERFVRDRLAPINSGDALGTTAVQKKYRTGFAISRRSQDARTRCTGAANASDVVSCEFREIGANFRAVAYCLEEERTGWDMAVLSQIEEN